jgi:hypothetical protein
LNKRDVDDTFRQIYQPLGQEHGQNALAWNLEHQQSNHLYGYLENYKGSQKNSTSIMLMD